ncbi:unnamed protein product [marine sediment metagenome]|uniref:YgiT-type zinc finger domain-containing protein n=1 Tax=marine sediment metagenome TaxID=412755 RepID=X1U4G5_9ZZZZ
MKRCYFCRGEIVEKKIRHIHQWGSKIIIFKDLPAEVCRQCGEVYLSPMVVDKIDYATTQLNKFKKECIEVPVIAYPKLAAV